jgi:SP family sugar:H+ symporter-like MFS transporter
LAFFTRLITELIDYAYGNVFAGCNLAAAIVAYLFLHESNNKSLEGIDNMYLLHVSPFKSSKWEPPVGEDVVTADCLMLDGGARNINKKGEAGIGNTTLREEAGDGDGLFTRNN